MRSGAWHQCGDKSQKLVVEELQNGKGTGVIISPRDLPLSGAQRYSAEYLALGAEVAIDLQFYNPEFTNPKLATYPTETLRRNLSGLGKISTGQQASLEKNLESVNRELNTTTLIAPALPYETGRQDLIDLNAQLLRAAISVGDYLGIPTISTLCVGRSATQSDSTTETILSAATSEACDGWYFCFEFEGDERIPSSKEMTKRFCRSVLALSCTGVPVFHAYSGPMAILSIPFGAAAAGIGHFHNLWRFQRDRWSNSQPKQKGGPKIPTPPRFFSTTLWGTIIYPDETRQLPASTQASILQLSPFSSQVGQGLEWDKWSAGKHAVSVICDEVKKLSAHKSLVGALTHAEDLLKAAVSNLAVIAESGLSLRDDASVYQKRWLESIQELREEEARNLEYLKLVT